MSPTEAPAPILLQGSILLLHDTKALRIRFDNRICKRGDKNVFTAKIDSVALEFISLVSEVADLELFDAVFLAGAHQGH